MNQTQMFGKRVEIKFAGEKWLDGEVTRLNSLMKRSNYKHVTRIPESQLNELIDLAKLRDDVLYKIQDDPLEKSKAMLLRKLSFVKEPA